jgi:hypothetical protein
MNREIQMRAIQLLKDLEWAGLHTDYEDSWGVITRACPACLNAKVDGHKCGCQLAELIEVE